MILSLCDNPDVLSVFRIIRVLIQIIKIVVPIILIIKGMLSFTHGVTEGEPSKDLSTLTKNIIAALLVFFIPTLVFTIADATEFDSSNIITCIKDATDEGVNRAASKRANEYVLIAKNTLNLGYYTQAKTYVNNLKDSATKNSLTSQLNGVKADLDQAQKEREQRKKEAEAKGAIGGKVDGSGKGWDPSKYTNGGNGNVDIAIRADGNYTKSEIMDMSESQVRNMSHEEFIKFVAAAAKYVYKEYGGVLPSITIAQACMESGYGDKFVSNTHNIYGLIGYPEDKPQINRLRQFDNFYEATYYHYAYFEQYSNVYGTFLSACKSHDVSTAAPELRKYAGGLTSYGSSILSIINQYNLTQYDY